MDVPERLRGRPRRRGPLALLVAVALLFTLAIAVQPAAAEPVLVSQGRPATASSAEGPFAAAAAVDGDPGTRWSSAVHRRPVDPRRPGRHHRDQPGGAALGGRVRQGVPDRGLAGRAAVEHPAHDHDGSRRHRDPRRLGVRAPRPHARHPAGHCRGATRSGSSRSTPRARAARPTAMSCCPTANREPRRPPSTTAPAGSAHRTRPSTATRRAAGRRTPRAAGPTRAGSRWTSVRVPRSTGWSSSGTRPSPRRTRSRSRTTARSGRPLLHRTTNGTGFKETLNGQRRRTSCADVRHAAQRPVRLLALGVPGLGDGRRAHHSPAAAP